ncbi:hypothetical protein M758_1G015100 [Ceratodon purpureus]|nr:hypothetical protein M758_1G015100 [Ceratodon purpureus]KAG0628286.1 hypothetical protein M758_1G015100 [Ceratodon purpureus]
MGDECTMVNNGGASGDGNGARSGTSLRRRSKQSRTEPMGSVNACPEGHETSNGVVPAQPCTHGAPYLLWPGDRVFGTADERAAYFNGLQKSCETMLYSSGKPGGQQASTLLDLMTIRAFHSLALRRYSLGTALGFRTRGGEMTNIPAIIVFVARKVSSAWLEDHQILPEHVEGPGALWCDIDVVEFTYYGIPTGPPREQTYTELVDGLRGIDPHIGAGTQVASQETFGTLGAIVRSQSGKRQVGFLTNRHVAVDLDYPSQKMFHPLPPNLGQGVYLGAVERATSFIKDDLWYGVFAGMNLETYVRADGAFVPFADSFDKAYITTLLRGVGPIGEVERVDLQQKIGCVIGRQVVKLGRSSGCTKGKITAYAVEYNDEKGVCFFTDLLVVGENKQTFDTEGDSGSLILYTAKDKSEKARPVGLIWGGTANRGRLKLKEEHGPENWTSGVDVGRLLDVLQLDLITSDEMLQDAILAQELAMPMPMQMSNRQILRMPACTHSRELSHEGSGVVQGGPQPPAAKEPMVFSMLKGNTVASTDLAEEELCRGFSESSVVNEKKNFVLLDLNDKNCC